MSKILDLMSKLLYVCSRQEDAEHGSSGYVIRREGDVALPGDHQRPADRLLRDDHGQASTVPVAEIDYQGRLLVAIGAAIGLVIVGMIVIAISSPAEADKSDQRDKDINRLGEYVGGIVLGFGMIVPFGLAMAEAPSFWIANPCTWSSSSPGSAARHEARPVPAGLLAWPNPPGSPTDPALRFAARRDDAGRTGRSVGVTRQTVIAIEQGRYSPSLEMAFQIARVFRVALDGSSSTKERRNEQHD